MYVIILPETQLTENFDKLITLLHTFSSFLQNITNIFFFIEQVFGTVWEIFSLLF